MRPLGARPRHPRLAPEARLHRRPVSIDRSTCVRRQPSPLTSDAAKEKLASGARNVEIAPMPLAARSLTPRHYSRSARLKRRSSSGRAVHMNGRVEDAITGRMLSADPHIPDRTNPQSYNRYSYGNNNPLTFTDPSGFCTPAWACKQDAGSGLGQCRVCGGSDPGDAGVLAAEEATGDQLAGTDESDASISDSTVPGQPGYAAYQAQLQAGIYAALGYPGVYTGNASSDASSDSAPADNSSSTDVSSSNLAAMARGLNAAADNALADLTVPDDPPQTTPGSPNWSNTINALNDAVTAADLGNTAALCAGGVCAGAWQGMNGGWYPLAWGGNGSTGARSILLADTSGLSTAASYLFGANVLLNAASFSVAFINNDTFGEFGAAANTAVSLAGTFGGPLGKSFSLGYSASSLLIAPYVAPIAASGLCSITGKC